MAISTAMPSFKRIIKQLLKKVNTCCYKINKLESKNLNTSKHTNTNKSKMNHNKNNNKKVKNSKNNNISSSLPTHTIKRKRSTFPTIEDNDNIPANTSYVDISISDYGGAVEYSPDELHEIFELAQNKNN